jgi:hypothetical protein
VFDYGQKSAAHQMRSSWEKIGQYFGTNYGQDITNEMQNQSTVIIVYPVHTDDVLSRHGVREFMIQTTQLNIQRARKDQEKILRATVDKGEDMDTLMKLAILQNKVAQGEFAVNIEVPVELNDSEKAWFSNEWCTYQERNKNLIKYRVQSFLLIQGQ